MLATCSACGRSNTSDAAYCAGCGARQIAPGADPRIGEEILGRYRITAKLGEGSMGAVYRAEQNMGTITRPVAIKILLAAHVRDPALRRRFIHECEIVVGLEHPNTIKFFEFGELPDGSLAIVMEYVDGESLASILARGPMPAERALRIIGQICGSLHEAHSRGIVHRDIKPENVLVANVAGERDVAKVLDFGIAKSADAGSGTLQGSVLGTPRYMSPEQFDGRIPDARSDVYSLGVMTYEMLTGASPFTSGKTVFEWAQRHLSEAPVPIDAHPSAVSLPAAVRATVMQALDKDPARRPASALDFARGLFGREGLESSWDLGTHGTRAASAASAATDVVSNPARASATPPTVLEPEPIAGTRSPVAALAIGAIVLGIVATSGGYYLFSGRTAQAPSLPPAPTTTAIADTDAATAPPLGVREPPPPSTTTSPGPSIWFQIAHYSRATIEPAAATGAPDQQYAEITSGGVLTLEVLPGSVIATDEGPEPDIYIAVDAARSGPYQVEAGSSHEHLHVIDGELTGTLPLDLDQYHLHGVRYVHLTSLSSRSVFLDTVGIYRSELVSAPAGH